MKIKVSFRDKNLFTNIGEMIAKPSTRTAVNQAYADIVNPWIPYDTGRLSKDITVSPRGITYNAPYSAEQYYGVHIHHQTQHHPLATAYWDKVAMETQREEFNREAAKIIIERWI